MRILVNDHSGHGFTLSLSKELAVSGNDVYHCFSKDFQSPKGYLEKMPGDPSTLHFSPLEYKKKFNKYSIVKRALQERKYAQMLNAQIGKIRPDIVICANTPLVAQQFILKYCRKQGIPFIYWCQDFYSVAIKHIARKRLGVVGSYLALPFEMLERYQLKNASCIVSITNDFEHQLDRWKIRTKNFVIPNWSPLHEFKLTTKTNAFSSRFNITGTFNFLYSGTLGLKHNPNLILDVCRKLRQHKDIRIVVVSEGLGADLLGKAKSEEQLDNLVLAPFQPFEEFSNVLSSADVFLAMLETDAGQYSVPSKVLSYLCAGKPIVIASPKNNLASRIVAESNAGYCISNNDADAVCRAVLQMRNDGVLANKMAANASNYAQTNFQIAEISKSFYKIIESTLGQHRQPTFS